MKKIVASVGLVAVGASAIQSATAQDIAPIDKSKPWSVQATLRGFYDDNTGTIADDIPIPSGQHRDSFGFEVSPAVALAWSLEQTSISVGYLYSFKWYENKIPYTSSNDSQAHTFNLSLSHRFSERYQIAVHDAFVLGQEPDLLRSGNTFSTFQRISGDNIRNYGTIAFDAQLTPTFGASVGYENSYYDYAGHGAQTNGLGQVVPSPSATLDRMEHSPHLEGVVALQPDTKGFLGYRYREIDYTGDELISGQLFGPTILFPARSDVRNSREHTVYVGAQHAFNPDFNASVRAGGSYSDYYNDPSANGSWTPYVNLSLRYNYLPDSYAELGFSYDRNATDLTGFQVFAGSEGRYTLDAESATVYGTINHHITAKLIGNIMAQFQDSTYNGGPYNSQSEQYYLAGVSLEYVIDPHVSAILGYNYDKLCSNIASPRGFDRNRVYIGVTGRY